MHKLLKILIPLLILALLIGGAYFYFFQFAPETTASIFVAWGDSAMEGGRMNAANKWYSRAYRLDSSNQKLAVDLANSFYGIGNYNKAEYYLLDALRQTPDSTDLYVRLCKVFVAQDKLLDAQLLLDDPSAPAELDAMRPAAPVFGSEPGYYSDYLDLTLQAEGGTVYASTDGQYPSVSSGPKDVLPLEGGKTSVQAICVASNGLVSPLAEGEYVIAGIVEPVTLVDPAMDACIRELLYKTPTQTIMSDELWAIPELTVPEEAETLKDLQYLTGLHTLTISTLPETDLAFLANMEELTSLTLNGCAVTAEQLTNVASATNLQNLHLSNCGLSSIAPLSALTRLEVLDLSDNFISDLSPLSGCLSLKELRLGSNGISDASPLAGLTQLTLLELSDNQLEDAGVLEHCTAMEELDLSGNQLTSISFIASMPALHTFSAANNRLSQLGNLSGCKSLENLDVSHNVLTKIDGVEKLPKLHNLSLNYNDVKVLPAFSEDSELQQFNAAHNFLEDITGLSNLMELNYVDVDYNNVSSLDCLLTCPKLVQVNAFGTNVEDVSAFDGMSIIINYNPT